MRGLIIKDLLYIKSISKNLIVMFIGSLLLSIALGNYLLAFSIAPIMIMASGISTFSTDEFFNTEAYTISYPLSRRKIVTSKYIFTLITMLLSTYIGLIIYEAIKIIINPGFNGINSDMLKQFIMLEFASLFVSSIFYPVIYKFGCEKSRFVLMSLVMFLLGGISILSVYVNVINVDAINFESIINFISNYGVYVLSISVTILFIVSYFLSILFYRHKDF